MTKLVVNLDPRSALNPRAYVWTSAWSASPGVPHIWGAQKRTRRGITVFEIELGNADIVRGEKARPQFDCTIEVKAPPGYALVADVERPWPFTWPPMHCAFRRYAIFPENKPELQAEAFWLAQGVMHEKTAAAGHESYGPANMPMPKLSANQRNAGEIRIAGWKSALAWALQHDAQASIEDSEDGLRTPSWHGWRPWGIPARGAPAGSGIYLFSGFEWTPETPGYLWLVSACTHERAWHAYDRNTGEVVTADWYGDPGPQYQQCTGDPNNGWLPEFRGVAQNPDPLLSPYDNAHSVRGFRHLVALSEMTDSPMVKRSLKSRAAQMRLQMSEVGPYPSGGYTPPSMRTYLSWARARPQGGFFGQDTGRQFGWPAYLIAQSIKKGCAENIAWAKMFVEMTKTAAMPNGIFSRCASQNPGDVWYDPVSDTFHAFEVSILNYGVAGGAMQAGVRVPPFVNVGFSNLYEKAPIYPYYNGFGPPQYGYCAARGGLPYQDIPGGKAGAGDFTHVLAGAALAASIDGNPQRWLTACGRIDPIKTQASLAGTDLRESAGLLAQTQRVSK